MKAVLLGILGILLLLLVGFVTFVAAINRPLPQNEYDVPILIRTMEILDEEAVWDRNDDRECESEKTQLSLYCALRQASIEVAGEFHHRAAALQEVRYLIDVVKPDNNYDHRLMDFNNDPTVTLVDVHELLREAIERLQQTSFDG